MSSPGACCAAQRPMWNPKCVICRFDVIGWRADLARTATPLASLRRKLPSFVWCNCLSPSPTEETYRVVFNDAVPPSRSAFAIMCSKYVNTPYKFHNRVWSYILD